MISSYFIRGFDLFLSISIGIYSVSISPTNKVCTVFRVGVYSVNTGLTNSTGDLQDPENQSAKVFEIRTTFGSRPISIEIRISVKKTRTLGGGGGCTPFALRCHP